jgi:hypothetical protein
MNKPDLPFDYTLRYIYDKGILPTVRNYLSINYGDITSLKQVGPEDFAEIDSLIEDGFLVDTESERVN